MEVEKWTRNSIRLLLAAYQCEPMLYDFNHPLYHNRQARALKLVRIAKRLQHVRPGTTHTDVKVKLSSLRTHFNGENTKIKQSKINASSPDAFYVPSIWWFEELKFLEKYINERKIDPQRRQSTLNSTGNNIGIKPEQQLLRNAEFQGNIDNIPDSHVTFDHNIQIKEEDLFVEEFVDCSQFADSNEMEFNDSAEPLLIDAKSLKQNQQIAWNHSSTGDDSYQQLHDNNVREARQLLHKTLDIIQSLRDKISNTNTGSTTTTTGEKQYNLKIENFGKYIVSSLTEIPDQELIDEFCHNALNILFETKSKWIQKNKQMG